MEFPVFDVAYFVKADRTRLKQVLINLLFNAVKYNRASGSVRVEFRQASERIRISVRDTGSGLTPQEILQLFQPFNRLGNAGGAEEGTGIGLVVTKRLVEIMGGVIGVDSVVQQGSVFWVEFPLTAPTSINHAEIESPSGTGSFSAHDAPKRTLLYVEDNPANLELVEQLIKRRPDLRLLSAGDASTGIEYARAYQPDAILMDINLPGISGIEAMKLLRADPQTSRIPIIALSANAVPRDVQVALDSGFFDYLTKPLKVALFWTALDAALLSPPDLAPLTALGGRR